MALQRVGSYEGLGSIRCHALRIDDVVHVFEAGDQGMGHGTDGEFPHRLELIVEGAIAIVLVTSLPVRRTSGVGSDVVEMRRAHWPQ